MCGIRHRADLRSAAGFNVSADRQTGRKGVKGNI